MGIPRFASRMRHCASIEVIATEERKSEIPNKLAVIDGPSLAHFIIQSEICGEYDNNTVLMQCNYAEAGEATIKWLERLQLYGFEMCVT